MYFKRKIISLIGLLIIISLTLISCSAVNEKDIDLSDIDDMNIGAEMPEILYGDDEKIIMHGTFGILTYNYKEEKITQRVNYDAFGDLTNSMLGYRASKDGKRIFILLFDEQKNYEYNLSSSKLTAFEGDVDEDAFSQSIFTADESNQFIENFGGSYLQSNTYLKKDNSILFLKADSSWQMKTLQLVEYDMNSNKELKVIDIFK